MKAIPRRAITEELRLLAKNLRARRRTAEVSQGAVGALMGCSLATVSQYESLRRIPDAQARTVWERAIVKLERKARRA